MHVLFTQPSTIPQPSGIAEPIDLDGFGLISSKWTSARATLASVQRGNICKTAVNGIKSWIQLHSLKHMPPDDHDDEPMMYLSVAFAKIVIFAYPTCI